MVTAVNKLDLSSVGSAMALVSQTPAVHGVAVAPRNSYPAPATITGPSMVTALAVNSVNRGQTGAANVQVAPSTTVSVQPKQSDATRGATVALTGTVTAGDIDDLRWVVYPLGAGTIAPDPASQGHLHGTGLERKSRPGASSGLPVGRPNRRVGSADIALKV